MKTKYNMKQLHAIASDYEAYCNFFDGAHDFTETKEQFEAENFETRLDYLIDICKDCQQFEYESETKINELTNKLESVLQTQQQIVALDDYKNEDKDAFDSSFHRFYFHWCYENGLYNDISSSLAEELRELQPEEN